MQIETNITLEDYRAFEAFFRKRMLYGTGNKSKAKKKKIIIYVSVCVCVFFALNFLSSRGIKIHIPTAIFMSLINFLAFAVIVLVFFKKAGKAGVPNEEGSILGEKTYIFNSDGLKCLGVNDEYFVNWQGIKSLEETTDHFFMMVDNIVGIILPKRSFSKEEMVDEFRSLIQKNV